MIKARTARRDPRLEKQAVIAFNFNVCLPPTNQSHISRQSRDIVIIL